MRIARMVTAFVATVLMVFAAAGAAAAEPPDMTHDGISPAMTHD